MIKRFKQIVSIGFFIGLFIGLYEGLVTIVLSSVDVFGRLPFLSIVALSFLVVLASLLVTAILMVGYGAVSLLKIGRGWSDEVWVGFFVGLGVAVLLFVTSMFEVF